MNYLKYNIVLNSCMILKKKNQKKIIHKGKIVYLLLEDKSYHNGADQI